MFLVGFDAQSLLISFPQKCMRRILLGIHFFKDLCKFNSIQVLDGADFSNSDIPKKGHTCLILLSQSGETKDLHRCIAIAREYELFTIGLVNVVDSLIAREVDCGCYKNAAIIRCDYLQFDI